MYEECASFVLVCVLFCAFMLIIFSGSVFCIDKVFYCLTIFFSRGMFSSGHSSIKLFTFLLSTLSFFSIQYLVG